MNNATPDNVEHIAGEVRVLREHLHDLIARIQEDRPLWEKTLADLPHRPRLTPAQRARFRRYLDTLARRQTR